MDHSKFIASIQKEEFISSFQRAKSELHVYDETPNLVNFLLLSLTELYFYSKSCKFHAESTPVMESFYEVYF